jgi:hypothetical protein
MVPSDPQLARRTSVARVSTNGVPPAMSMRFSPSSLLSQ